MSHYNVTLLICINQKTLVTLWQKFLVHWFPSEWNPMLHTVCSIPVLILMIFSCEQSFGSDRKWQKRATAIYEIEVLRKHHTKNESYLIWFFDYFLLFRKCVSLNKSYCWNRNAITPNMNPIWSCFRCIWSQKTFERVK